VNSTRVRSFCTNTLAILSAAKRISGPSGIWKSSQIT
jgi:hypothetical protein